MFDRKKYAHEYYLTHKKDYAEKGTKLRLTYPDRYPRYVRKNRAKLKLEVLGYYSSSPPKCVQCGIADLDVLSIDHINGGGKKQREQIRKYTSVHFYQWLKNNNYPNGYQVLCMNCNWKKEVTRRRNEGI